MLRIIAAAYRDTCAADLSLRLGLAPQPALSTLSFEVAGGHVELRLLGHSHQVLARLDTGLLSEVVACGPGRGGLPAIARHALGGAHYHFQSRVASLTPGALARRAERLLGDFSEHPAALVGAFPGWPDALTVVVARVSHPEPVPPAVLDKPRPLSHPELAWRSWHLYPQTAEVVLTRSRVWP